MVVQGRVEGTFERGRSLVRWMDQIKSTLGDPALKIAIRDKWQRLVKRIIHLQECNAKEE